MAFNLSKSLGLFLVLNLLLFTLLSSCGECGSGSPRLKLKPRPKTEPKPITPGFRTLGGDSSGSGSGPSIGGTCPIDALKLGVCLNVLNGLINVTIGTPPKEPCCPLILGLVGAEVPICLCTAVKANILGINLNIPVDLSLLVNYCGGESPRVFECF